MYPIIGGDFDRAGFASRNLKTQLKRIGAESSAVRRVTIAAYEAEMNVVIHAHKGNMIVNLQDNEVEVRVEDDGPGIADIDRAMQEGFSTAPPEARALGFGAGLGLPNIKRHSDRFGIESTVGQGTRVRFSICLRPQPAAGSGRGSVRITEDLCRECLHCLRACPTRALRVREARPQILEHLCIDCPLCLEACETGALGMESAPEVPEPTENTVLVLPGAFLVQFGWRIGHDCVMSALRELGFRNVRVTGSWEQALRRALVQYAAEEASLEPVISPACPAVVNLIETRFPSLIGHLAPFVSPLEAVQQELMACPAVFVALCPSQRMALTSQSPSNKIDVIAPSVLRQAMLRLIAGRRTDPDAGHVAPDELRRTTLVSSGVRHALNVLEQLENGLLEPFEVIELSMCDQGCFGSPLLSEDPVLARRRWTTSCVHFDGSAKAIRRRDPFVVRPGVRLAPDMSEAIAKLAELDALTKGLPGKDCGMCGAPTCAAFAEDVVLGRATMEACVRRDSSKEDLK